MVPVFGATESGKSQFILRLLAKRPPPRLLVWNPIQEKTVYPGVVVRSLADLAHLVLDQKKFSVVFDPGHWDFELLRRQFDYVCKLALQAENLTFIAEELKHVTRPQAAPGHWRRMTGDGRQYGVRVFGISQRPAQMDKDFLANATAIRTGRLAYPDDIDTVARYMRVERAELEALQPLDWIERDMKTGTKAAGRLTF